MLDPFRRSPLLITLARPELYLQCAPADGNSTQTGALPTAH